MHLLSFAARNHRSLRERVQLDLTRPSLARLQPPAGEEWGDHLHRVVGIFGANASGKSAVIDALAYARAAISLSATDWQAQPKMPRAPFALDSASNDDTSHFEFAFVFDDGEHGPTRFDYEFEVSPRGVERERLQALYATRRERLFERDASRVGTEISFPRGFPAAAVLRGITRRELLLSRAVLLEHPVLAPIGQALIEGVDVVRVGDSHRERRLRSLTNALASGDADLEDIATMLRVADIGIESVSVTETELPPDAREFFEAVTELAKQERPGRSGQAHVTISHDLSDAVVRSLDFTHRSEWSGGRPLDVSEESTGTIAWLAVVVPAVEALTDGSLLVVDELDAALHPYLVDVLVGWFADEALNVRGAQLIFSGHGTHVMSPLSEAALTAEQVWFTEKRKDGVTELFSLADFPHREGENKEKRYLDGRYGAVPRPAPSLVHGLLAHVGA